MKKLKPEDLEKLKFEDRVILGMQRGINEIWAVGMFCLTILLLIMVVLCRLYYLDEPVDIILMGVVSFCLISALYLDFKSGRKLKERYLEKLKEVK